MTAAAARSDRSNQLAELFQWDCDLRTSMKDNGRIGRILRDRVHYMNENFQSDPEIPHKVKAILQNAYISLYKGEVPRFGDRTVELLRAYRYSAADAASSAIPRPKDPHEIKSQPVDENEQALKLFWDRAAYQFKRTVSFEDFPAIMRDDNAQRLRSCIEEAKADVNKNGLYSDRQKKIIAQIFDDILAEKHPTFIDPFDGEKLPLYKIQYAYSIAQDAIDAAIKKTDYDFDFVRLNQHFQSFTLENQVLPMYTAYA